MATSEMLVESRITLGWDCLLLFDLQDGRVGLHDGHDDPVNVVLQAEVDLFLLLNRFHELWKKQEVGTGHTDCGHLRVPGLGEWVHYLIAGD